MYKILLFLILNVGILFSQSLYNGQGHIPSNSQIEWFKAGLMAGIPTVADNVFNVTDPEYDDNNNSNYDGEIQAAINDAKASSGLSIIYFPAGTYRINSTIDLSSSSNGHNIVFQGKDAASTVLEFLVGKDNKCFYFHGSTSGSKIVLNSGINKGDHSISVSNASTLGTNDWVHYFEYNFPIEQLSAYRDAIGQISKVESKNGNTISLIEAASKNYSTSYGPYIQKIIPIQNVGIENLKIKRLDSSPSSSIRFQ